MKTRIRLERSLDGTWYYPEAKVGLFGRWGPIGYFIVWDEAPHLFELEVGSLVYAYSAIDAALEQKEKRDIVLASKQTQYIEYP